MTPPPNPAITEAWLSACGDLAIFQKLQIALDGGRSLSFSLTGYLKPMKRTQRNFYKWLNLKPQFRGLCSARLTQLGPDLAELAFSANKKFEKRGRRKK